MEWVLRSPQIHSIFSNLGFEHSDGYHINENCNVALETILHNILTEDQYLRTFRRNISFGQNIQKDLLPLLLNAKDDKTIELLVTILVNVTIPIECLLSVEDISKFDFGRHTIFEINNLLVSTKHAFTDHRATKVVIDFLKKNLEVEQQSKLSSEQCTNITNSLLLLRNILHIPEENSTNNRDVTSPTQNNHESNHTVQNQILWNIFSQSIDKLLIKLMTVPEASNWAVTMVQVIALLYKDQHVATLQKHLSLWLETSLSESSEDNESNTSPPVRGSEDSSPVLTSDPTSDSSDTDSSRKSNDEPNSENNEWTSSKNDSVNVETLDTTDKKQENTTNVTNKSENVASTDEEKPTNDTSSFISSNEQTESEHRKNSTDTKTKVLCESSDCGYGTQMENQESVSTSSNENDEPKNKTVHQKPNKPRINKQKRTIITLSERKRRKIVKRGKANIINVQGLSHQTPTDEDISNILKEFTVDFLLKGYNSLVHTLHSQILSNLQMEMDSSHFFWLVSYFLKFAMQIELDLEHISSVLSFEVVSYLTSEGVNLCEQFELAIKLDGNDLRQNIRRLHLVITAIRELVQAIEVYKKHAFKLDKNNDELLKLQIKVCDTEELRLLLVLLLRNYNPKYHTKQYLQDLIVTNHVLLMFMDSVIKLPNYNGTSNLFDHLKQFASPELMHQFCLLLEDFVTNEEFVNDCIFTLMHHIAGDLGSVMSLFQPNILKTFTSIWTSDITFCDDWSDLIEFVINTFIKKPQSLQSSAVCRLEDVDSLVDEKTFVKPFYIPTNTSAGANTDVNMKNIDINDSSTDNDNDIWTEEEISSLSWNYMQCHTLTDVIGEIVKKFLDYGITKSRESIIHGLFKHSIIAKDEYESFCKEQLDTKFKSDIVIKEERNEIGKLCEQLILDGKLLFLDWVQKILLETCYAKIFIAKKIANKESKIMDFALFKNFQVLPAISPVAYYSLLHNRSVPLVPWNCEQASICKDLKFLQLLHKLGFQMPVDTGKVFIRIPHVWTADILFEVASKVAPIDILKLKFSINDISDSCVAKSVHQNKVTLSDDLTKDISMIEILDTTNTLPINIDSNMDDHQFNIEGRESNVPNWLEVVKKSQKYKLSVNLDSICETASVASDLTRMYVSDEDEKSDIVMCPPGGGLLLADPLRSPRLESINFQ